MPYSQVSSHHSNLLCKFFAVELQSSNAKTQDCLLFVDKINIKVMPETVEHFPGSTAKIISVSVFGESGFIVFKEQLLGRSGCVIDLDHVLGWERARQPCSSLVIDSGEPSGSAHLPAKWLLLQAVAPLWIDWHKRQSLIRHVDSSTFRTTPDACVSPVGS